MQNSVEETFSLLPASGEDKTFAELIRAAETLGLSPRALQLAKYEEIRLPRGSCAIVRLCNPLSSADSGHFVVLTTTYKGFVQVLDLPHAPYWVSGSSVFEMTDRLVLLLGAHGDVGTGISGLTIVGGIVWILVGLVAVRKSARPLLLFGLAVGGSSIAVYMLKDPWPENDEHAAALIVPESRHIDLVVAGDEGNARVRLLNNGNRGAKIKSAETGCACASVNLDKRVIEAGGSSDLQVQIRLGRFQQRSVKLVIEFEGDAIPKFVTVAILARRTTPHE